LRDLTNLKKTLRQVKENDYQVPTGVNVTEIIFEMLENIGNPDPELRDQLIYTTFFHWILEKRETTEETMKEILKICLDDMHLFYKIGENNTNSVFTRSFSVLLVPLILVSHRKQNLLNKEEIMNVFHNVTRYFLEESDLRGYVEDDGWAHSVAHTADALNDLALCTEIGYKEFKYMLEIIQTKICVGNYVYIHKEDERMVTAITSILERNLIPIEEICIWVKSFSEKKNPDSIRDEDDMKMNIKNFLRSLYFRLLDLNEMEEIVAEVKDVLNTIGVFR
jgi:hypothetical protein